METTFFQKLMNEAYAVWNENPSWSRDEFLSYIAKNLTTKHLMAVKLGNLNYQVENGGFYQWDWNGYSSDLSDLMEYLDEIGTDSATEVRKILTEVGEILKERKERKSDIQNLPMGLADYHDCLLNCMEKEYSYLLGNLDSKYYKINEDLIKDVDDFLKGGENGNNSGTGADD